MGVRYTAFLWEPQLGIRIDLGVVGRPGEGTLTLSEGFNDKQSSQWIAYGKRSVVRLNGKLVIGAHTAYLSSAMNEVDLVAMVDAKADERVDARMALVTRYKDADTCVAAFYHPKKRSLYLIDRRHGIDGPPLGTVTLPLIRANIQLSAEVRGHMAMASITDGEHVYSTHIVEIENVDAGTAGLLNRGEEDSTFDNFQLRRSPVLTEDEPLPSKLYDARGGYRGDLAESAGWYSFSHDKHLLLDGYRPGKFPTSGDWVLVLDAM